MPGILYVCVFVCVSIISFYFKFFVNVFFSVTSFLIVRLSRYYRDVQKFCTRNINLSKYEVILIQQSNPIIVRFSPNSLSLWTLFITNAL